MLMILKASIIVYSINVFTTTKKKIFGKSLKVECRMMVL
ncbi:hypothetical protein BN938_0906 [Mucinivorans hirudinis]|uniref:Uncharacterized protein n=1 Tax=Mucinivorans hirudinis TaxID=1433126 RepID=A0A060R727_9BACT|nr:hypothetical protein BN938_0906 [Mucinivorans hirudinis]